ncbi:MAG: hypothetical protein IT462_17700 [Planctomycetes bacterium]|nr:hypothetical protein [Planctomycetota bacterium]
MRVLAVVACLLFVSFNADADRLEGDAIKHARDRLKEVKKAWPGYTKAEKLPLLNELSALNENSVGDFLLDCVAKEADADTASEAARALARHGNKSDAAALIKAFNAAKEPARKAACLRWLGKFGEDAPDAQLLQVALGADAWGEAAVLALDDTRAEKSAGWLDKVATDSKSPESRCAACACLITRGDMNGVRGLSNLDTLERVAQAANAAAGGPLEADAVERLIDFAKRGQKFPAGVRPHNFAALLGRLQNRDAHQKLVDAAAELSKSVEVEVSWWLIGWCNAKTALRVAKPGLEDEDKDRKISGLRYLQNAPEPLKGDDLLEATKMVGPFVASTDVELSTHAMLACAACGITGDTFDGTIKDWARSDKPLLRSAAMLAIARAARGGHAALCVEALSDKHWYVVSSALEALRVLRPPAGLTAILDVAKREQGGRIWAESIALLRDLTAQDFGDDLAKWDEWITKNASTYKPEPGKLKTLRGVAVTRVKAATSARFFNLEFESENVEFTLDRSISMIDPMRREPGRPDFAVRKADILKRRAEVKRMMKDGFLPRFHAACVELAACLEHKEQRTRFGITLFNTELETYSDKRTVNGPTERKAAVNWMLSSEVKGGTDIQRALLAVIEKGEADTILLLSDGEPLSLGIIEQIQRANVFRRVDIHIVNLAKAPSSRGYLQVVAQGAAGKLVDAEPK